MCERVVTNGGVDCANTTLLARDPRDYPTHRSVYIQSVGVVDLDGPLGNRLVFHDLPDHRTLVTLANEDKDVRDNSSTVRVRTTHVEESMTSDRYNTTVPSYNVEASLDAKLSLLTIWNGKRSRRVKLDDEGDWRAVTHGFCDKGLLIVVLGLKHVAVFNTHGECVMNASPWLSELVQYGRTRLGSLAIIDSSHTLSVLGYNERCYSLRVISRYVVSVSGFNTLV